MNLKKHLKLKEEEVPYTEQDKEFFESLVKETEANAQEHSAVIAKKRKKLLTWLTPFATVAACGIIAVICVFTVNKNSAPLYKDEFIKNKFSNFNEMQSDLQNFIFENLEDKVSQVELNYDAKSGDKLYYTFKMVNELSLGQFIIVINENYEYKFDLGENIKTESLTDYSVTYKSIYKPFDVIPSAEYKGYIKVETETVYFEYTQVPAAEGDDQAFFQSIQQIIQIK